MRVLIIGLGNQGKKRRTVAGDDVVATVDPVADSADYRTIHNVPPDRYDAAMVCTPDNAKLATLRYLLGKGVHVLVEKPLLAPSSAELRDLAALARSTGAVCYTAYNHRFEPHIIRLKDVIASGRLGQLYLARFHYGNGTARDVRQSQWRDQGLGVLADLGSHVLDLARFVLGGAPGPLDLWQCCRIENQSYDSCLLGGPGKPALEISLSLLSWRNTFTVDVIGAKGSAHIDGLCKWGPSRFTVRDRVLPSGKPTEETTALEMPDPTWAAEYTHFQALCAAQAPTTLDNDIWINDTLAALGRQGLHAEAA